MVKRISKITIGLAMLISVFFVGISGVKAEEWEIDVDVHGSPATEGKDPCYEWSYVCIVNYAAVRVTYYDAETGTSTTKDFFDNQYKSIPSINRLGSRFNNQISGTAKVNLGDVPKKFTSKTAQSLYKKILTKMEDSSTNLFKNIVGEFIGSDIVNDENKLGPYIKQNANDYIFIEPIYQAKIQDYKSAQSALSTKQGNWKYYYGTATRIAQKVNDQYGDCIQHASASECNQIYLSRKEKAHVSRIANNLRLDKNVDTNIGPITKGTPKAKKNVTTMQQVADDNKGYGIAGIKLGSSKPDPVEYSPTCYLYSESTTQANCDENSENYKNGQKETTVVGSKAIASTALCNQGVKEATSSNYESHSKYGKLTASIINGVDTGKYCSVYCVSEENINVNTPTIYGMKKIGAYPASATSSSLYFENFKIDYEQNYTCYVDLVKAYGMKLNQTASSDNSWFFKSIGDSNYSYAQAELYPLVEEYILCKEMASVTHSSCAGPTNALNTAITAIETAYNNCATGEIDTSNFATSIGTVKMKVGNQEIELKPSDLVDDNGGECVGCQSNITTAVDLPTISSTADIDALDTAFNQLITNVLSRDAITYRDQKVYEMKNRKLYNLNTNSSEVGNNDNNYGEVADEDLGDNQVCSAKESLLKQNKNVDENTISVQGLGDLAADGNLFCNDKITYSTTNIVTECPANTLHAGTNAYYWLANGLIDPADAMQGYNSATAIQKFCNDGSLSSFDGGYEPIINENGDSVIDGCLSAGFTLPECEEYSDKHYYCTDGKNVTVQIDDLVYNEAKRQKMSLDEAYVYVKNNNSACTNACYEEIPPKDFVYRTISLNSKKEAFPGFYGKGRTPGNNWNNDDLIEEVITSKNDVYTKDPIYVIELNSKNIKFIRNYNKNNSYTDFKLKCNKDGAFCISDFLNKQQINTKGKCADISIDYSADFASQKAAFDACLN